MAYYFKETSHTFNEYLLVPGYSSAECIPEEDHHIEERDCGPDFGKALTGEIGPAGEVSLNGTGENTEQERGKRQEQTECERGKRCIENAGEDVVSCGIESEGVTGNRAEREGCLFQNGSIVGCGMNGKGGGRPPIGGTDIDANGIRRGSTRFIGGEAQGDIR